MRLKDMKAALLQKGWAGRTLSRSETVDRLNPIIREHMALNHAYNFAIKACGDTDMADSLAVEQKTARTNVEKLMETVFSCGGVAYNGVDMEPVDFALSADNLVGTLQERETAFLECVSAEEVIEHHMRTRAVLKRIQCHSEKRLSMLRELARKNRA